MLPALRHVPASVEAPPIYTPTSANRRPRRYKFRRERPATSPCLLALPADARQSPKEKARARKPTTANRAVVNWICVSGHNREVCSVDMGAVSHAFADLSWRRGLCAKKPRVGIANGGKVTGGRRRRKRGAGGRARCMRWSRRALFGCAALNSAHPTVSGLGPLAKTLIPTPHNSPFCVLETCTCQETRAKRSERETEEARTGPNEKEETGHHHTHAAGIRGALVSLVYCPVIRS